MEFAPQGLSVVKNKWDWRPAVRAGTNTAPAIALFPWISEKTINSPPSRNFCNRVSRNLLVGPCAIQSMSWGLRWDTGSALGATRPCIYGASCPIDMVSAAKGGQMTSKLHVYVGHALHGASR